MVEIREVKTWKEKREFVSFPLKLYKGNPNFVPPLYGDELKLFNKKHYIYETSESKFFLAYRGKEVVGRIQAIYQKKSNEVWNQKRVRFGRFDFIDDKEVSTALLDAVKDYALSLGMDELVGPLGFDDMDREGLLVEGFDEMSTFEEQYNASYYEKAYLDYGFEKECEWVESRLTKPEVIDEKLYRITDKIMAKNNLRIVKFKSTREILKHYGKKFFDIVEETYADLYMTVPFTENERKSYMSAFKLIITPDLVKIVVDENNDVVCFGLVFPAIGRHLQKRGGRLTPLTIIKILREVHHPKALDLGLVGVRKDYLNSGIHWSIARMAIDKLSSGEIEYCDTNLNMVDNTAVRNMWKYFSERQNKRRRCYSKKIA